MGTVERNLLEGGLIVVFVLVLLLGILGRLSRFGHSAFHALAVSMMNLFGVSGNLMCLGLSTSG